MRLLITSGGITNASIHDALVGLLGKPVAECSALCIPTAIYAFPGGAGKAWQLITGRAASPLCGLGWKSLGVLELTAVLETLVAQVERGNQIAIRISEELSHEKSHCARTYLS